METRFPVPPGVVGRVIQAAADPDTSVMDLAQILEKDPVLSSQVLRSVNSAMFGLRHKVATVDRAVGFMGIRGVRNLVLSLGVRDLVPTRQVGEFPIDSFWTGSLRRAAAAQCLAELLDLPQAEEFFTLGVCQDIGVLVRLEELAQPMALVADQPSDDRLAVERKSGEGHDQLGFEMFSAWGFPDELTIPIHYHHRPQEAPPDHRQRAQVAAAAEALADLASVTDHAIAARRAIHELEQLGLEQGAVGPINDRVNELVEEYAEVLGLKVQDQPSLVEIIELASRGLVELNRSYAQDNRHLEHALASEQQTAEHLRQENRTLEQEARTDTLTGLANRRAFDEALERELFLAQRQGAPLSILIIDVDHFKAINDTHGHLAGDAMLKHVGQAIGAQVRTSDTAARYGGEEFAVILPFTDKTGGRVAAERIRAALERVSVEWQAEAEPLRLTASVGGITLSLSEIPDRRTGVLALRQADDALYQAKEQGRNQVCWA